MKLRYTRQALAELNAILGYIADQSPRSAVRVKSRIQSVIDILLIYPSLGIRTDDPSVRRLTTTPYSYLVYYEHKADEIIIHSVRHGARMSRM